MYIAVAKSYEEPDIKSLHTFTYKALQHSVSDEEYKWLVHGRYRQTIFTDPTAFKEQIPFYKIRPLYTGFIYLLYKAGIDIGFATHMVSGIAIAIALVLLYLMSSSILGSPFSYTVPFFALIFGLTDLARLSTPDAMAFLAIILSAYLYLKDRLLLLIVFLPLMLCIRTDLILYTLPLLFIIFVSKRKYRAGVAISTLLSIFLYSIIGVLSKNPGWSTIFYFTLVKPLTHPLSNHPTLTAQNYIYALYSGIKDIPHNSNLLLYGLISSYYFRTIYKLSKRTFFLYVLKSPEASLSIVCVIFVFSHFILFPVAWNRYFVGPYVVGTFSLLVMMTDYLKMVNFPQLDAAPDGNSAARKNDHC